MVPVQLDSDEEKSVKWLNVNLGPFLSVLEHWRVTHRYRMALLETTRVDNISIPEYFAKFPVLRQPEAVQLVSCSYFAITIHGRDFSTSYSLFSE